MLSTHKLSANSTALRLLCGLLLMAIALFSLTHTNITHIIWQLDWRAWLAWFTPQSLQAAIAQAGIWGPLVYIAVIAVSVVISQIPGAPMAIAAGTLWHPLLAGAYTVAGGFSGALIAYWLGSGMGQPLVKAITGKTLNITMPEREGAIGWVIFTTRLLPIFSFDLVSYGAGMMGLSWPIYASATFFGMVPSTLMLTYLGDSFQPSASVLGAIAAVLCLLFVGVPALLHRYNLFDLNTWISYE